LPDNLYKSVKYIIKDYDRLKGEYQNILMQSATPPDGMPKGKGTGNPTMDKAIKCETVSRQIDSIDTALIMVPIEYRRGVFNEARYGGGFPLGADPRTYQRWKQRFIYWVADNMGLV
jgi:hypothetical protein